MAVVLGFKYGPEFDNYQFLDRVECDDDEQLIKIFKKNRISLAVGVDEGGIRYLCKKAGIDTEVVYAFNENPSYVAFSKALGEKGKVLAEKFSEALRKLKEEGGIEKIQSKYF